MKNLFLTLAVMLIVSFVFAGCSGTSSTPATKTTIQSSATTQPSVLPQFGGTLSMSVVDVTSLGYPPDMTGSTDGPYSSVCLEALFRFDEQLNLVPLLALDWKADTNAKTVTITLRKGVKFHDGTIFDAAACKWNLEQYKASGKIELLEVASIDVIDDSTIRLNLAHFDNTIVSNLASNAGRMISPTAFQTHGGKDWAIKNPVGTGPFQFVDWQKDVAINWKRFDGYWDGKPYLDGVTMKRYADATIALMDFKAGNLDIFAPNIKDEQDLRAMGKFNVVTPPMAQIPQLAGYAKDPNSPFADLKVRQALSYAIDAETMANSFGMGYWKLQNQWTIPGTWAYNPNVVGYPYNPQKAKDLLAQAGYPNGFKTTLNFFNVNQASIDEITAIQGQLKNVGIDGTLNPLQRPAYNDMASVGKGWSGIVRMQMVSTPDPLSQYTTIVAGNGYGGLYLPKEFVDAYSLAIQAPDFATKQKLVWQLTSLATDKYCMVTYSFQQRSPLFKTNRLHDDMYGLTPNNWLSSKAWFSK